MKLPMNKVFASTALTATALAGGLVLGPSIASAQDGVATETTIAESSWVDDALSPLVADGTLTQSQADAVGTAIQDARPERSHRGHRGPIGNRLETLSELGLDADGVREGLANGQTLGEIAEANGVSADAVVDALIANSTERIDAAVESGRLTNAEADEKLTLATERAEGIVDGTIEPGDGRRGLGPRGHHGAETDEGEAA